MVNISAERIFLTWRFHLYMLKNILRDPEHLIGVRLVLKTQLMAMLILQWKKSKNPWYSWEEAGFLKWPWL